MKKILHNERLKKVALTLKPWAIFIGVFFLLKVTGIGTEISTFTQSALLKAGVMDARPEESASEKQTFDYNFTVTDLEGRKIKMTELKGKVIFINLWATWCGPCRAEMSSIQKLYESVDQDNIAFVMLSLDAAEDQEKIVRYIRDKAFTFPVYQPSSPLPRLLRVNSIPATFIIGPDGKIAARKMGMANYDTDEMRAFLRGLI